MTRRSRRYVTSARRDACAGLRRGCRCPTCRRALSADMHPDRLRAALHDEGPRVAVREAAEHREDPR